MSNDSAELKERISKLSDEELLTMVNVKYADYRQESLDYAVAELVRRGVSMFGQNKQPQVEEPVIDERYKGVGGWLLLLCLNLAVFSPLLNFGIVVNAISEAGNYSAQFPKFYAITIIDSFLTMGLMCFSIYAGVALWSVKPNAVKIAKIYLLVLLGFSFVEFLLPFMAGLPSQVNDILWNEGIVHLIYPAGYFAIWFAYLNLSKRVQATYSRMEGNSSFNSLNLNR